MESIVGSAALDAIAQQDAVEKQAIDAKATSALSTANEVAGQFITVKAAAEAATATATNAYTSAQTANAAASNAQTQTLANRQAIVSEANTRGQADTALQTQITNIVNGTTVVDKATNDANGNDIPTTYVTKAELAPVATSGDYDDLTNKPTAGTNIEISVNNVISAPNVPAKTEAVGSFTLSLDPQTYELSIQAKDINGTNIGTAQTVDLPIETMVVSGSYDDATQSITLTLQNGQTITFSVAGLVAGLQTQLTFDSTPTNDSPNPVTSGGVYSALVNKQNTLSQAQLNAVNSGITDTLVTKLNGIETGAEVNVQADWSTTDSSADSYIKNKPSIPTTWGTAAEKNAGSAAGNVPLIGTALGTTNDNIVVTDASDQLKPSGTTISTVLAGYDKIAQQIPNNTNLDDLRTQGWYFAKDITNAGTITGKPSGLNNAFGLRVVKTKQDANGNVCQIFIPEDTAAMYIRIYANGSWGSWLKEVTENNLNCPWLWVAAAGPAQTYITVDYQLTLGGLPEDSFGIEFLEYDGFKYFIILNSADGYPVYSFDTRTFMPYIGGVAIDRTNNKFYLQISGYRGFYFSTSAKVLNITTSTTAPAGVTFNPVIFHAN